MTLPSPPLYTDRITEARDEAGSAPRLWVPLLNHWHCWRTATVLLARWDPSGETRDRSSW